MSFKGAKFIYGWSLEGCDMSLFPGDGRAFGLELGGFDLFCDGSLYLPGKVTGVEKASLDVLVGDLSSGARESLSLLGTPRLIVILTE